MTDRDKYKDIIVDAFTHLDKKVEFFNCLNLQNININIEDTFRDLLNLIYTDRTFINLNSALEGNFNAIDLGDDLKDISFQVTSTTERIKVVETINKYKTENNYKKVIMLYCKINKPKRTKDFSDIIDNKFILEEWDLKDLLKVIPNSNIDTLQKISELLHRDIISNIPDIRKLDDISAIEGWEITVPTDIRNITDKLKSVCDSIQEYRINKYCRDIAIGKVELSKHSERDISAMKYRIFDVCQEELIEFFENREENILSVSEINSLIERYTNRAVLIIEDKSKDYKYPLKNRDILRKTVLALIDECYLSFDEEGIYS